MIMLSSTYRQRAVVEASETALMKDPTNTLLWRQNIRRLEAEQVRDAMLAVSGDLDLKLGGPGVDGSRGRRSVYVKVLRNNRDPLLDAFDFPDTMTSAASRDVTTTATQALLMVNGDWVLRRAKSLASRIERVSGGDEAKIDAAYQLAFGRAPSSSERLAAAEFLRTQEDRAAGEAKAPQPKKEASPKSPFARTFPRRNTDALLVKGGKTPRIGVPDNDSLPISDFTVEAYFMLESLYEDATVRTIVSKWDSNTRNRGWAFGVTSTRSKYDPRNLIIQLTGDTASSGVQYRVIASNLRPKLNTPYYAAASVNVTENNNRVVNFYLRDLSTPEAPLQTATVEHDILGGHATDFDVLIGARANTTRHAHGRARFSAAAYRPPIETPDRDFPLILTTGRVAAHWKFEKASGFFADSSPRSNHLSSAAPGAAKDEGGADTDARRAAMIDFCHALLNSNEFLYVD